MVCVLPFTSEMLAEGSEKIVNENGRAKTGEKERESKREAVETRDEAVKERWINALFELCKRSAWVIENKLCVCVKEAENGSGSRKERKMREGKKVTARDRESDSLQRQWAFTVGFM